MRTTAEKQPQREMQFPPEIILGHRVAQSERDRAASEALTPISWFLSHSVGYGQLNVPRRVVKGLPGNG